MRFQPIFGTKKRRRSKASTSPRTTLRPPPLGQRRACWLESDAACRPKWPRWVPGAVPASLARSNRRCNRELVFLSTVPQRELTDVRPRTTGGAGSRTAVGRRVPWGWLFWKRGRAVCSRVGGARWLWPPRTARGEISRPTGASSRGFWRRSRERVSPARGPASQDADWRRDCGWWAVCAVAALS